MFAFNKMAQPEFREMITASILDVLDHLPEAHKNIFVWKHYRGLQVEDIASTLNCSKTAVEETLRQVDSAIVQKTGALLA